MGEVIGALLFWAILTSGFMYIVRRGRRAGAQPSGKPLPRSMSSLNKLEKLKELHDSGALTDEEFQAEKAKVLR